MNKDTDQSSAKHAAPLIERLREPIDHAQELLGKDIWELEHLGRRTLRARAYQLLRILTLTWQGLRRNHIPLQSAALTFYSLIGIGPLIVFGIMISSFLLDKDIADPNGESHDSIVIEKITQAIAFAAPQMTIDVDENGEATTESGIAPEMLEMINNFSAAAKSGTVGALGSLTLLFIGIQVLISIEKSFNTLWGVAQGRKLAERIVTYWTFISLGAVGGTAAITLISVNTFIRFAENLPFGNTIASLIQFFLPVIIFVMISVLLAVFFRFIPNTQVKWSPAMIGGLVAVSLLTIYKSLSVLYVERVVSTNLLYGSVGFIIVLMFGLYFFWLFILMGGQITYAVQNADYLTNENAWQKTSQRSREVVSLGIMLLVAQRFQKGAAPIRSSELHQSLRVPSHILNISLNRLCDLGYLYPVGDNSAEDIRDRAYQPGRPIESITLKAFKHDFECYGNNEGTELLAKSHPGISSYLSDILSLKENVAAEQKISDLIQRK